MSNHGIFLWVGLMTDYLYSLKFLRFTSDSAKTGLKVVSSVINQLNGDGVYVQLRNNIAMLKIVMSECFFI